MNRDILTTFWCNEIDSELLVAVADRLQRNKSDTMRFLIRRAAEELQVVDAKYASMSQLTQTQ